MFRPAAAILLITVAFVSCRNSLQTKEKVQEAVVARLQTSSGLDLPNLDVTTTAVTFNKNLAYATVAFHPKGDTNINSGMTMKYTLEEKNGKWAVIKVGDSQGHGLGGAPAVGAEKLPPGHPSLDSAAPGGAMPIVPNPHVPPPDRSSSPHGQVQ